jgi:hypothetical protein
MAVGRRGYFVLFHRYRGGELSHVVFRKAMASIGLFSEHIDGTANAIWFAFLLAAYALVRFTNRPRPG